MATFRAGSVSRRRTAFGPAVRSEGMELTEAEMAQLATVVETVLEEGYDLDGVDEEVLEAVRQKLAARE